MFFQRSFDDVNVRRTIFRQQHHLLTHINPCDPELRLSYAVTIVHE
jgi:hypothetical protein